MTKRKYAINGMYDFETTSDDSPRGSVGPSERILIRLTHEEVMELGKLYKDGDIGVISWDEYPDIIERVRKKMIREDHYKEEETWQFMVLWSDDLMYDCETYYDEHS